MKQFTTFNAQELKRLPGLVEVVASRTYTKAAAKARSKGKMPKDLTTPFDNFILEEVPEVSASGRSLTRYLLLTYTEQAG